MESEDQRIAELTDFLLEHKLDLEELEFNDKRFNPLKVLKTGKYEIRHSSFLAWLFNPKANHEAGSYFLDSLISLLSIDSEEKMRILLSDHSDTIVRTENNNRDIEITNKEEQWSIIIENKFLSGLSGPNQLLRYYEAATEEFDFEPIFLFLSPNSRLLPSATSGEKYQQITYHDISKIILEARESLKLTEKIDQFLLYYLENLMERRMTTKKTKAQKIAEEIYFHHKSAIDYIVANKPVINRESNASIVESFLYHDPNYTLITPGNHAYIRFLPTDVVDYFKAYGSWNTLYLFALELTLQEDQIRVKLCFGTVPNDQNREKNQHLKDQLFKEMTSFKCLVASKTRARSSSNYPAAAWYTLMKVDDDFIKNDFEDIFKQKFGEFEKNILEPWVAEIKASEVFGGIISG